MFKKKNKDDASRKVQPGSPAPAAAPAGALAPLPGSVTESGRTATGLRGSFSNMPAAGSDAEQAAQAAAVGKNRSKISVFFDVILPLVVAIVCVGAFGASISIAKDRTGVYGRTAEELDLEVPEKLKSLADEKVIAEINKLAPLKLLSQGEVPAALEAAKAMVAKSPSDVKSLMCGGMVMVEAGSKADREAGIKYCEKAYQLAKFSRYIRLLYGRALTAMRRDDDAIAVYEKIIQLFPTPPWSVPHKEVAALYMKTNSSALAVKELEALIKSDNSDPGAQRELGLALAQDGKQAEGFEEFQKGFTREQDILGYPYAVKSIVEAHAGIVSSALKDTEKRYAKNPDDIETMLMLARLQIASNKYKEAREVMEKALIARENDPDVHEVMSEVMCRQNQSQSGYDEFRAAASHLHLK